MKRNICLFFICCILLLAAGAGIFAASAAGDVRASGTISAHGSYLPWRLYDSGTLMVEEGFINQGGAWHSPWVEQSGNIERIVFHGPVTAGASLSGLFRNLSNVTTIEGLCQFDTQNVTNMSDMFYGARGLTSLDLSSFDTRNVTDMYRMLFFPMPQNQHTALRQIILGPYFVFQLNEEGHGARLPDVRTPSGYTGRWQNIGPGTIEDPQGTHALRSYELMNRFDGSTMADTWVWQRTAIISPAVILNFGESGIADETLLERFDGFNPTTQEIRLPLALDVPLYDLIPDISWNIYGDEVPAGAHGYAFWGWFEDGDLDYRLDRRDDVRRPERINDDGFDLAHVLTAGCLDADGNFVLYAVYIQWGDVMDIDDLDWVQATRLVAYLSDPGSVPINRSAGMITLGPALDWADATRLVAYLSDPGSVILGAVQT